MTGRGDRLAGESPRRHGEVFTFSDATFRLMRDLIVERTGILFDDSKRASLAEKLSDLVVRNGLTSLLDYYYLLRYDEAEDRHWNDLIDRLSVPETYFWRQPEQFMAVGRVVLPTHIATHPGRPFRIWSAACCTGEEPLSVAIALAERGMLDQCPVEIVGTDASPAMIERARLGVYGERSFRQMPAALKERYFEAVDGRWRPIERIRSAVQWGVINLVRPCDFQSVARADVIFCRNVFIYFADDVIRRVAGAFADAMPRDGYLFLGAAESLTRLGVDLELVDIGGAFAYVKPGRREVVERIGASALNTL